MQINIIEIYFKALETFTQGKYSKELQQALKEYYQITGEVLLEEADYENKMQSFNTWYLLNFMVKDQKSPMELFLEAAKTYGVHLCGNDLNIVKEAFDTVHYSVFEFIKVTRANDIVLNDVFYDLKTPTTMKESEFQLAKNDLFTARILNFNNQTFILPGICLLPKDAKKCIKKKSKEILKSESRDLDQKFVYHLEKLKSKWLRYNHVGVEKLFNLSDFTL